ncbi:hypothetical protein AB0O91_23415 [Kitasatospora sp. NPDC089797]|uniref:hypothetical protein n=1 Tax=Kitasatospora sp. NPDC089797 TaxID=3155298 RepID=UPI00343714D5
MAVTARLVWLYWRTATTYPASAGHGGADPYGLYAAALRMLGARPLALAQTGAAALALGYAVAALARLGVRARWSVPTALLLVAVPPTGAFTVALAPDVPFTVCALLATTTTALRLLARRADGTLDGRGPVLRFDLAVLAAALLGLGPFHQHSPLPTVLAAALPLRLHPPARWATTPRLPCPRPRPGPPVPTRATSLDQICTDSSCTTSAPTFFTTKRLTVISTQVLVNNTYRTVDTWNLNLITSTSPTIPSM